MSQDKTYDDRQYGDLAASVATDPTRSTAEQETSIGFDKGRDRATVYTSYKSLMKRFLLHPEFELEWYETNHDESAAQRIDADEYDADGHDRRKPVYALKGTVPIGVIGVKQSPRKSGHADVVTSGVL